MIDNVSPCRLLRLIRATRIAFFIAGLSLSAWAPLIPLARLRLTADNGTMGLVLLAFGIGSLLMMPLSGALAARYGCQKVFTRATVVMLLMFPALVLCDTPFTLAAALFVFGAGIGAMDVVANIQAVAVEKLAARPIMSGFHALFSIGGIAGSGVVSLLLICDLPSFAAVSAIVLLVSGLLIAAFSGLISHPESGSSPLFAIPRGIVILLGTLCFIAYLMEGSMLDWSGILLTSYGQISINHAGLGYITFAFAMTLGRLCGDHIIKSYGRFRVFLGSSLTATLGFVLIVSFPDLFSMLAGFFLVGMGLSNIAPMLFTAAGRQTAMSSALAVAAVSSIGYSGILLGPAFIGTIAQVSGLATAFVVVAALSLSLPACSYLIKKY